MARVSRSRCSRDARLRAAGGGGGAAAGCGAAAGARGGAGAWRGAAAWGGAAVRGGAGFWSTGGNRGGAGGWSGAAASAVVLPAATAGLDPATCATADGGVGVAGLSGVIAGVGAVPGVCAAGVAGAAAAVAFGGAWLHAASRPSSRIAVRFLVTSFHVKEVELIAIEVAEITGVETPAARARCAFVGAPELQGLAMHRIDPGGAVHLQRHHDAVPDRRRLLVEGFGNTEPRLIRRHGPGDELLGLHHARGAQVGEQGIVVRRGACEIVGTQCHVPDHHALLRLSRHIWSGCIVATCAPDAAAGGARP